jgi:hypothetical protein
MCPVPRQSHGQRPANPGSPADDNGDPVYDAEIIRKHKSGIFPQSRKVAK